MAGAVVAYMNMKKNRSIDSERSASVDLEAATPKAKMTERERIAIRRGFTTHGLTYHQDSHKSLDGRNYHADVIGKWYRQRKLRKGPFLSKELLAQRLDLEDMIFTGMARLVMFCIMFVLLYIGSSTGVTSGEKLQVNTLITSTLGLDEWKRVTTLEELRNILPDISSRIKAFSASSSQRFQNRQKVQLIGRQRYFATPTLEPGLFLPVMRGEFTMTAWVQPEPSHLPTRSIIRKYTRKNSELDCWGWYHPNVFTYGAHDYHSLEKTQDWQEYVTLPLGRLRRLIKDSLSHQAIVVANKTVTFFYDGQRKGTVAMNRDITDCEGKIEIGGFDMSLSAFNFYPNALQEHQILEIYERGQPLSELATGSNLRPKNEDSFRELDEKIDRGVYRVSQDIDRLKMESRAASMTQSSVYESQSVDADPVNPYNPSPAAYLPGSHPASTIGDDLEREEWIAAGSPTGNETLANMWATDSFGAHFSVLENSTYANGEPLGVLPTLTGAEKNGFTLSFWDKHFTLLRGHELLMQGRSADGKRSFSMTISDSLVSFMMIDEHAAPALRQFQGEYLTWTQNDDLREDFVLGPGVKNNPGPLIWRHLSVTLSPVDRVLRAYVDGSLLFDTISGTDFDSTMRYSLPPHINLTAFFEGMTVTVEQDSDNGRASFKIAQLRLYPRALDAQEVMRLQDTAVWPSGDEIKQCIFEKNSSSTRWYTNKAYSDSIHKDDQGHSCEFYEEQSHAYPSVCASAAVKLRCPVACKGKRECYDGSLYTNWVDPDDHPYWRIFDRVMHVTRATEDIVSESESIVCPSSRVSKQRLVEECLRREQTADFGAYSDYKLSAKMSWAGFERTDLTNCGMLAAAVAEEQCAWNASWIDEFKERFARTGRFSMTFWVKAVQESKAMPDAFLPSIHFYSRLMAPKTLADIGELQPRKTKALRLTVTPVNSFDQVVEAKPTSNIRYSKEWTMMYFSVERTGSNGEGTICLGINALRMECADTTHVADGPWEGSEGFGPEQFLEGIEFSTEMLVSPIEVTASVITPSELQKRFYAQRPKMERLTGPWLNEVEREEESAPPEVNVERFDRKAALISPPVLFQSRSLPDECAATLTHTIIEAQLDLIHSAHCPEDGMCGAFGSAENASSGGGGGGAGTQTAEQARQDERYQVFSCAKNGRVARFFGTDESTLGGRRGFSDFLYSIADSSFLMRDDEVYSTREFLDIHTQTLTLLAVFHVPQTGITSVLRLVAEADGLLVAPRVQVQHLAFLNETERERFVGITAALFVACACSALFSCWDLARRHRIARKRELPMDWTAAGQTIFEICMVVWVAFVAAVLTDNLLGSEAKAEGVVGQMSTIPFASEKVSFNAKIEGFFAGLDDLNSAIAAEQTITSLMYPTFVVLLIRIIHATSVHPRTGILTSALSHGANDLAHFALLFLLIFVFFTITATWMFGSDRNDFADLTSSMKSQFQMLLGELPPDFQDNASLIAYVVLSNLVFFFLMLNFVLAIVVESYMKVRDDLEALLVEKDIVTDLWLSAWTALHSAKNKWPSRREMETILMSRIGSRAVTAEHFRLAGLTPKQALTFVQVYSQIEPLQTEKPPHLQPGFVLGQGLEGAEKIDEVIRRIASEVSKPVAGSPIHAILSLPPEPIKPKESGTGASFKERRTASRKAVKNEPTNQNLPRAWGSSARLLPLKTSSKVMPASQEDIGSKPAE